MPCWRRSRTASEDPLGASDPPRETDRLDRWLWHARFFKTRSLAARVVASGVRVNGTRMTKGAVQVGAGDVLTFAQGARIRIVRIAGTSVRRGPASEARLLYEDLDPPTAKDTPPARVGPRPTKKARRDLEGWRDPEA